MQIHRFHISSNCENKLYGLVSDGSQNSGHITRMTASAGFDEQRLDERELMLEGARIIGVGLAAFANGNDICPAVLAQ
jgi:hypothetical protein